MATDPIFSRVLEINEERRKRKVQEEQAASASFLSPQVLDRAVGEPLRKLTFPTPAEESYQQAEGRARQYGRTSDINPDDVLSPQIRQGYEQKIAGERADNPLYGPEPSVLAANAARMPAAASQPAPQHPPQPGGDSAGFPWREGLGAPPEPTMGGTSQPASPTPTPPRAMIQRYKTADGEWKDLPHGGTPEYGGTPGETVSGFGQSWERQANPSFTPSAPVSSLMADDPRRIEDEQIREASSLREANIARNKALRADPFAQQKAEAEIWRGKQDHISGLMEGRTQDKANSDLARQGRLAQYGVLARSINNKYDRAVKDAEMMVPTQELDDTIMEIEASRQQALDEAKLKANIAGSITG